MKKQKKKKKKKIQFNYTYIDLSYVIIFLRKFCLLLLQMLFYLLNGCLCIQRKKSVRNRDILFCL